MKTIILSKSEEKVIRTYIASLLICASHPPINIDNVWDNNQFIFDKERFSERDDYEDVKVFERIFKKLVKK